MLAAAEVAAFTLATSEATHTLTGRIEPATVEVSEGTAIPVVHVLEPSSLIHEEHPTQTVEPGCTRWHLPPMTSRLEVYARAYRLNRLQRRHVARYRHFLRERLGEAALTSFERCMRLSCAEPEPATRYSLQRIQREPGYGFRT